MCQGICIYRLVKKLMRVEMDPLRIMVENKSVIMFSKNSAHDNMISTLEQATALFEIASMTRGLSSNM